MGAPNPFHVSPGLRSSELAVATDVDWPAWAERGHYPKLLLRSDTDRLYLFKMYRSPEHDVVAASEVTASRLRSLIDPDGTVEVRPFVFEHLHGTIQPFLTPARPVTLDAIIARVSALETVLAEHPPDWLVGNHDAHLGHVISVEERLVFVDKGQAFRYFGQDRLDANFHPNSDIGRVEEPVYNLVYRSVRLPDAPPRVVTARLEAIAALPDAEVADCIDHLAGVRARDAPDRRGFLDAVLRRRDTIVESFARLYHSFPRGGRE